MRFASHYLGVTLGLFAFACGSNASTTTVIVRPDLIAVSPDDFLGSVVCDPEAPISYVATLFDVTPATDGGASQSFQLPSSPATPCVRPVTFSYVVAGHRYLAEVDAYAQGAKDLAPLAPGARPQVDATTGARVSPRWYAKCGGYPASPATDAGANSGTAGAAGAGDDGPPGVLSYSTLTQTPHDCGAGLGPI